VTVSAGPVAQDPIRRSARRARSSATSTARALLRVRQAPTSCPSPSVPTARWSVCARRARPHARQPTLQAHFCLLDVRARCPRSATGARECGASTDRVQLPAAVATTTTRLLQAAAESLRVARAIRCVILRWRASGRWRATVRNVHTLDMRVRVCRSVLHSRFLVELQMPVCALHATPSAGSVATALQTPTAHVGDQAEASKAHALTFRCSMRVVDCAASHSAPL
jgi:hypothetical protein